MHDEQPSQPGLEEMEIGIGVNDGEVNKKRKKSLAVNKKSNEQKSKKRRLSYKSKDGFKATPHLEWDRGGDVGSASTKTPPANAASEGEAEQESCLRDMKV